MTTRTLPPAAMGAAPPKDATLLTAVSDVHEFVVKTYGDPTEWSDSYVIAWNDEYEWCDGATPLLQWEEGPYNWHIETSEAMNDKLRPTGWYVEPVRAWGALGFFHV